VNIEHCLYRLRHRRGRLEAVLGEEPGTWTLQFVYNSRVLVTQRHPSEQSARAEAGRRLVELEQAGWIRHW